MTKMTRKTALKYPFLATEFHSLKSDTHSWAWGSPVVVKMNRLGTEGTRESSHAVRINLRMVRLSENNHNNSPSEECLVFSQTRGK